MLSYEPEAIREHLATMFAAKTFSSSPRLQKFLHYVVDKTLTGESGIIKEYVIATEVYGRGAEYDPQVDSTVRVEASRLRSKLRQYYENEGRETVIRIELPKGAYVPVFKPAVAAAPETTPAEAAPEAAPQAFAVAAFAHCVGYMTPTGQSLPNGSQPISQPVAPAANPAAPAAETRTESESAPVAPLWRRYGPSAALLLCLLSLAMSEGHSMLAGLLR
jgi:hypothetical protein